MTDQNRYDAVVIGAGHNGLTGAAYLARKGRKVLVLERRDSIGGLTGGYEFFPGYKAPGALLETGAFSQDVIGELKLGDHGLKVRPNRSDVLVLSGRGEALSLFGETAKAVDSIRSFSEKDASQYIKYRAFLDEIAPLIWAVVQDKPLDLDRLGRQEIMGLLKKGWSLRGIGRTNLMELMRLAPMPIWDFLGEWFENGLLMAGLALPAFESVFAGPWSPGTTANLLLTECLVNKTIVGGPAALVDALEKAAVSAGVEIRTGVEVESLVFENGRAAGVKAGGETIPAGMVLAGCDPRRLTTRLIPRPQTGGRMYERGKGLRGVGHLARIDLALTEKMTLPGPDGLRPAVVRFVQDLTSIEKAFDRAKYRGLSDRAVMDAHLFDASVGCSPEGGETLCLLVHFVPYNLEAGWGREAADRLMESALSVLADHDPGVRDKVAGSRIMTPADLESEYAVGQGCLHHLEGSLDQIYFRPFAEAIREEGLFPGLHVCGSGAHPLGGITGMPGRLAAM